MKKLISLLLLVGIFLLACGTQTAVDPSQVSTEEAITMQYPESDNGKSWALGSRVEFDTQVYHLTVQVISEVSSNQAVSGSIRGYSTSNFGNVSGRMWTDGKGILPVIILGMSPSAAWIDANQPFVLKTSDLKIMGVPPGAVVDVICNHDVEVLSPVFIGQTLTTDRLTHELDNCRMVSPHYNMP